MKKFFIVMIILFIAPIIYFGFKGELTINNNSLELIKEQTLPLTINHKVNNENIYKIVKDLKITLKKEMTKVNFENNQINIEADANLNVLDENILFHLKAKSEIKYKDFAFYLILDPNSLDVKLNGNYENLINKIAKSTLVNLASNIVNEDNSLLNKLNSTIDKFTKKHSNKLQQLNIDVNTNETKNKVEDLIKKAILNHFKTKPIYVLKDTYIENLTKDQLKNIEIKNENLHIFYKGFGF